MPAFPGYSQLYDVQYIPHIIFAGQRKTDRCKKLTYQQIDECWQLKVKGQ